MSRYGINIKKEEVREFIFKGLAGGDGEDEALDIVEIVAILMIPMLVKVSDSILAEEASASKALSLDQQRLLPPAKIIEDVLQDILSDSTGGESSTSKPPELTPYLLRQIFLEYDEFDLVNDDRLITEMIALASNNKRSTVLDVKAFARALTSDVNLYNPENETRYTEILSDVFPDGMEVQRKKTTATEIESSEISVVEESHDVKRSKTLPHMDYTADTFIHSLHITTLWLVIVFSYYFYMFGVQFEKALVPDDDKKNHFGYQVAYAILRWIITMLKLV